MYKNFLALSICLFFCANAFAGASEWYDLELRGGLLLIDVKIGGVPAKALLDTGAQTIAVDTDFLDENEISYRRGNRIILTGAFGEIETRTIKKFSAEIFGTQFPIKGALPMQGKPDFPLIIGAPFFKNFIVQIDYPNRRMKIIDRKSLDLKSIANVDLSHSHGKTKLVVTADMADDGEIRLLLDIGNSSGVFLERQYAERRGWIEKYSVSEETIAISGVNKTIDTELLKLPSFKIGPYELEDVLVLVPASHMPTNITSEKEAPKLGTRLSKGVDIEGNLGYDVLKHFVITLDAKTARMHIFAP